MATVRAQVLTSWNGSGTALDPYRPAITDDFPAIISYKDITRQPAANITPDPNLFIAEITCSETTLDAIEADLQYGDESILWSEDIT